MVKLYGIITNCIGAVQNATHTRPTTHTDANTDAHNPHAATHTDVNISVAGLHILLYVVSA